MTSSGTMGGAPDKPAGDPHRILFVVSTGGHLTQLAALRPWWESSERRWVTFNNAHAINTLVGEHLTWAFSPTTRNLRNAVRNLALARQVIRTYRPDIVVSTGAGVAVPFFVYAKWRGVRTLYIEVIDRVSSRTLTGRLVYPFTDGFAVQWDEQLRLYPGATVIGPTL
jgi:UDP-N-acetylglucosamine:LPS N-acetylglucosamine transferase